MKKEKLKKLVGSTIFSVEFTKKNGDKRKMLCKLGVTKHLQGGEKKYDHDNLLTVFSLDSKAYRTVNMDTLESIKYRGKVIKL